ncbi:related to pathway-specific regulatory protein nit-4 [Rhynchosporium agropyri]|uniref:Related to pathway-specific regulatory protein nit-4 n=1 Tax=Rhynchosporium agropyri TaxID=914238 RepID=A0A1E1KFU4_9HELO|nr:related to pathway-specific regulatory protein nit-4 [Rhynchosporium agropyri]
METQPLTTQMRTVVACEACRKRKRKCDGAQPCSLCQNHQKECHYESGASVGRKRKRDLEYVSKLEEQFEALKTYVKVLENQNQDQTQRSYPCALNSPEEWYGATDGKDHAFSTQTGVDSAQPAQDTRLTSAVHEVGSLMWKLSIDKTGDASFIGPSGNFCFSTSPPVKGKKLLAADKIDMSHRLSEYSQDARLCRELFQTFEEFINPFHQFVQFPALVLKTFEHCEMESALLQSAIFAAGSRLLRRPDASQIGECFASNAEKLALKCCRDQPSLVVIQALTIMSVAGSLCTHLGLHVGAQEYVDPGTKGDASSSDTETDSRTRTFWQFFLVDRIATSLLGRQCSIPWKRVRTPPFQITLDKVSPLHEVVFDHQCRLWLLHDQFMDQIHSFDFPTLPLSEKHKLLMDAREKLLSFHQATDDRLRFGKVRNSEHVVCFQMSYQMSLILIHRPYLQGSSESGSRQLALRSMTAAATTMTLLIRAYRKLGTFNATSSQQTLRHQSINKLRVCIEALEELRLTWHRAQKSIALLQELANQWSVVFALPMRLSNVIPLPCNAAESEGEMPRDFGPTPHEESPFDAVYGADNHAFEMQESMLSAEPVDAALAPGIADKDFWMNSDTLHSFVMQDDRFTGMGLDWLFGPQV